MLGLTMMPLAVWYELQLHPLTALHQYDAAVARDIVMLNVFSIGILVGLVGWLLVDIYRKMETD